MPRNEVKNEVFEDLTNREIIFRNFAGFGYKKRSR